MTFTPSSRPKPPEDGACHITVSDPVQHSEGINKFTSFRVDVRGEIGVLADHPPTSSSSKAAESSSTSTSIMFQLPHHSAVLRRYSDFAWLYEKLGKERAGAILPPLPEKQVARFSPEFIEERRCQLELFLRRVAVHPELYDAPSFITFLRADDVAFHAAKNSKTSSAVGTTPTLDDYYYGGDTSLPSASTTASSAATSAYGGASMTPLRPPSSNKKEGIKQWLAETKTSLQIAAALGGIDLISSPDDTLFEEMDRYILSLEQQMKNVLNQVTALVRKGKEIANGMFEFGLAFGLLSQSEQQGEEGGGVASALAQMGSAADGLSVLAAEQADGEEMYFEVVLREYLRMIQAVKKALEKRAEKRLTYTTCVQEVHTKRSIVERYRGYPGKEDKAFQAQASLQRAHDAAEIAREDFCTVSQRILREMDRFKREKADEMRYTVLNYIELQIQYNQKMEEVWARLIPDLEQVQIGQDSTTNDPERDDEGVNDVNNGSIDQRTIVGA